MPTRTSLAPRPALRRQPSHPGRKNPDLDPAERDAAAKAKAGSARLRLALLRYGAKHGLPNLSPQACLAALEWLEAGRRGRRKTAARASGGAKTLPAKGEPGEAPRRKRGRPRKDRGTGTEGDRHGTRG